MASSFKLPISVTAVCPVCDKPHTLHPHQAAFKVAINVACEETRLAQIPCGCDDPVLEQLSARKKVGSGNPKLKRVKRLVTA